MLIKPASAVIKTASGNSSHQINSRYRRSVHGSYKRGTASTESILSLPANGMDVCAQLRGKMLSMGVRLPHASGYLPKSSASVELLTAIEQALAGNTCINAAAHQGRALGVFLRRAAKPGWEKLTYRPAGRTP